LCVRLVTSVIKRILLAGGAYTWEKHRTPRRRQFGPWDCQHKFRDVIIILAFDMLAPASFFFFFFRHSPSLPLRPATLPGIRETRWRWADKDGAVNRRCDGAWARRLRPLAGPSRAFWKPGIAGICLPLTERTNPMARRACRANGCALMLGWARTRDKSGMDRTCGPAIR
jgi:hypothetical protein